jgi:arylformamidase
MIYDISPLIDENIAVWPGDTPFSHRTLARLRDGDTVNLSDVRMSCHTGAHADAPSHFDDDARTIDEVALEPYLGDCVLLDLRRFDGRAIGIAELDSLRQSPAPRVLLRTRTKTDRRRFDPGFSHLQVAAVEHLASLGVVLIGLDTPSVDAFDSRDLPVHHALGRLGILNLESLCLDDVPAGRYELIALPLRLCGRDASPVRAVLRSRGHSRR